MNFSSLRLEKFMSGSRFRGCQREQPTCSLVDLLTRSLVDLLTCSLVDL